VNSAETRLRLFGPPVLSDADGTPVGGEEQPHRIALLAFLALQPNRTAAREELTAHLWSGLDQKEANQLLNRELFSINKALGDDAIFSNAKEVRLGSRVAVDALDFQTALDAGRPGDAIDLYTGPLLDGFTLDDAPEFQGWAANQRARFAAARKALRPIAEAAADVERDMAEPKPPIAREIATPPPEAPRKRRKSRREVRAVQEPQAEAPHAPEEPPAEAPRAPKEPPAEAPRPPKEPPARAPRPPKAPAAEAPHAPPEPLIEESRAAQDTPGVFWSLESSPVVGRAAQQSTPEVGPLHTSQEMPVEFAPPEPAPPLAISREAPPPPADVAPESAEPVVWLEAESVEHVAEVPPGIAESVADVAPPKRPAAGEAKPSHRAPSRVVRRRRRLSIPLPPARLVITVVVLVLVGVIGYLVRGPIVDAAARARSVAAGVMDARARTLAIAVLPLELSGRDPADQALAAGISDALARMLARAGLRVTPGDMFAYRTPPYDIRSIAETLGVNHVLQGTMQKDDTTVRFRFQLVSATDGVTRWEQTYAPKLEDIMVLQEDVAITVARLILERPPTGLVQRETRSPAAYQLVLRGNDPALIRSDSGALQALELFQRAVALDSGYARAWAGLARLYARTTATLPAAGRDRQLALATQAARRAVTLNDSLAESHAALGVARGALFDMAAAETHMQRALELDPTRAAHESLVELYLWAGRHDEALAIAERARERDPRSPFARAGVARVLMLMNRCDEALTHLVPVAGADAPTQPRAAETRALCHAQAGRWNDAIAAARSAVSARDSSLVSLLGWLHRRAGNGAEAERIARLVNDRVRRGRGSALDRALLAAGARDFDAAARRVQEAVDARSFMMAPGVEFATLTAPVLQELHRHRGFVEARRRLGNR
jgi:TolB-like protein/DNA-binding SARP family transcriptional activator